MRVSKEDHERARQVAASWAEQADTTSDAAAQRLLARAYLCLRAERLDLSRRANELLHAVDELENCLAELEAPHAGRFSARINQFIEGKVNEEEERCWRADFRKLGLDDARDVTRGWLQRIEEYTGGVDEVADKEVLLYMAMSSRRQYIQSRKAALSCALRCIDSAAENALEAQTILEERFGIKIGLFSDIQAMLKQLLKQARKVECGD